MAEPKTDRHEGVLSEPAFAPSIERAEKAMATLMQTRPLSQPEAQHRARPWPTDLPMLLDGDLLQVTNDSGVRLVFKWARKPYVIEPGETEWVIFQALVNALGDPRSVEGADIKYDDPDSSTGKGIVPAREKEWARLFAYYGVQREDRSELEAKAPQVVVKNMKGQRVFFPAADTGMLPYPAPPREDPNANADVTRMMGGLRDENEDLRGRVDALEALLQSEIERRGQLAD